MRRTVFCLALFAFVLGAASGCGPRRGSPKPVDPDLMKVPPGMPDSKEKGALKMPEMAPGGMTAPAGMPGAPGSK